MKYESEFNELIQKYMPKNPILVEFLNSVCKNNIKVDRKKRWNKRSEVTLNINLSETFSINSYIFVRQI